MASVGSDLENVLVSERETWLEGPPHDLFRQLRGQCPVHWTSKISEYPQEAGGADRVPESHGHEATPPWPRDSGRVPSP